MSAAYDGKQFVGINLHRRRSVISRTDQHGEVLEAVRISNDPKLLAEVMGRAGEHPEVVLEATYGWYWAADVLTTIGANVHLAHPLGVKAFAYRRVKNDFRDAADLADLLRMGRLPEACIAPPQVRDLRQLVRHRAKLVAVRSAWKCQVHAVLAACGVAVRMSDLFGQAGTQLLDHLQLPTTFAARVSFARDLWTAPADAVGRRSPRRAPTTVAGRADKVRKLSSCRPRRLQQFGLLSAGSSSRGGPNQPAYEPSTTG